MISPAMAMYEFLKVCAVKKSQILTHKCKTRVELLLSIFDSTGALLTTLHFLSNLQMGSTNLYLSLESFSSLLQCNSLIYCANLKVTKKMKCSE
jgi:hypothetical protein